MTVEAFRVQNFMGFEDSGWIELRPITLLFGRNSTGKSATLRALLLLKQSLSNQIEDSPPLLFVTDNGFDFGDYREMVRGHRPERFMSFWFQCRFIQEPERPRNAFLSALQKIGGVEEDAEDATIQIRLIYGLLADKEKLGLYGVDLFTEQGDLILQASPPSHNPASKEPWSFASDFFDPAEQPEPNLWPFLELFAKNGFLPWVRPTEGKIAEINETYDDLPGLGEFFDYFWLLLKGVRSTITIFFDTFEYLGPLRSEPQRFYYSREQVSSQLAKQGKNFVRNFVAVQRDPTRTEQIQNINKWLIESGFNIHLEFKPLDKKKTLFELLVVTSDKEIRKPFKANLREVGFGISQVLPVIIQTLLAPKNSIVLIEQPELHLHPGAQAQLGDLFIRVAMRHSIRLVIETHSEHLLLRLRRRIAETTAVQAPADLKLQTEALGVYFIDKLGNQSVSQPVHLDNLGDFENMPRGFQDFFADDLKEIRDLNRATRQVRDKHERGHDDFGT